ncbi:MAG: DUF2118 domain-containing protein [Desulfurococcaceae archaeon]
MDTIVYSKNLYVFPEVFIENNYSNKCIVETLNNEYIMIECSELDKYGYKKYFGSIPYESVLEYIDLVESVSRRGIVVAKRESNRFLNGFLIETGTKLCIIEITGYEIFVDAIEGEEILEGRRIAYIVTNKNDIRVYKSPCSGLILLVIDVSWEKPCRYIVVVVDKNECRRINIREST